MCSLNVVEDEYHYILQCEKYIDVRRRYLKGKLRKKNIFLYVFPDV